MAASITVHLQIFKRPQLLCFSTDLDETGIKMKFDTLLVSFLIIIFCLSKPVARLENSPVKYQTSFGLLFRQGHESCEP